MAQAYSPTEIFKRAIASTVRAIAERLVISERTVETHVAAIYRKLGVANRRALVALLGRTGTPP